MAHGSPRSFPRSHTAARGSGQAQAGSPCSGPFTDPLCPLHLLDGPQSRWDQNYSLMLLAPARSIGSFGRESPCDLPPPNVPSLTELTPLVLSLIITSSGKPPSALRPDPPSAFPYHLDIPIDFHNVNELLHCLPCQAISSIRKVLSMEWLCPLKMYLLKPCPPPMGWERRQDL